MSKHWKMVGVSYGRVEGRIKDPEGNGNPIREPMESTEMDIGEFSETEQETEYHTGLELDTPLPAHMNKTWIFFLHVGPQQLEGRLSLKL